MIGIEQMIRHPSYNPPAMYADIALVKLKRTVTFSTLIKPACLYQLYDNVPMKVWVSGWGVTEFGKFNVYLTFSCFTIKFYMPYIKRYLVHKIF